MSTLIGIDPGLGGGIAFYNDGVYTVNATPTHSIVVGRKKMNRYDIQALWDIFLKHTATPAIAAIETQTPYIPFHKDGGEERFAPPGVKSARTIGYGEGMFDTMLTLLKAKIVRVAPRTWQKILKGSSEVEFLQKRFPTIDLLKSERCTTPHSGIVDALSILEWLKEFEY